jgi:2-desacetyl-2-hydroxyethyl bacteriochlorophyllide A dehydrogenase
MQALELVSYNKLELKEVATPVPAADELLIEVKAVGICGSDVHGLDGSTGRRVPPVIMGHEASGVVADTGERCSHFRVGDRVTFDSTIYCGECFHCRRREINLCENRRVFGVSADEYRQNGAYAQYVTVPERSTYVLPERVSFEHGAMVEPLSIALHAAEITPLRLAEPAVIIGAGVIGLLTLQVLRRAGAGTIVVSDVMDEKLERARELGAELLVNPKERRVRDLVLGNTGGRGAAVVFDCVGTQASVEDAVGSVRRGGTVTLVGNLEPRLEIPYQYVVSRQIRLQGSCASSGEYPACLELMARGDVDVDALISAVAPLSEGAHWFDRLYRAEPGLLKVILEP